MVTLNTKEQVLFMDLATRISKESSCKRLQVGTVILRKVDERFNIISMGYNGTPPGEDNCCETKDWTTKPEVIHAELNAITKLNPNDDYSDCVMVITHSPCLDCAKILLSFKIPLIYYREIYRSDEGVNLLKANGVTLIQI